MARQARALATRQAVLLAAAEVFDERGYAAATMAEILERARVTKGALYFHFHSKEELALAVIAGQGAWLATWQPASESPVQTLIDLGYAFAHALLDNPVLRGSIRLTIEHGSFTQPQIAAYQGWTDAARELLEHARDSGELRPGVEPAAAAGVITGAVTGIQLSSQVFTDRRDLLRRMADLWTLLLPGLVPPHTLARLVLADRLPPAEAPAGTPPADAPPTDAPPADAPDPGPPPA
ncbi:ScbR family autoregulator-binding transcription factor [Streptomyces sp. BE20]|uniref:ScbR family autoregulator-binding transcription factor n=1 Tax=Streptomyces sp. BE20 TaxID=3002525 RepID=UPI002E79343C|nr:ScbR family autoregulator-binding transcription factor [Streptomyces sp. BE20]MEE1829041.1 ScbR family autoregulator-binding transcription factor [Streptomyces sp. BE20]